MSEIMGIDVSHYQGKIDWAKVKAQGKRFAIMKCQYEAQSHRADETFEYNYSECGKNGIARGVYLFVASSSIADPIGDAKALLGHLKGRTLEYGIWLDFEANVLRSQGKEKIRELANVYGNIFQKAGYYVGIYCNQDWYNNVIHPELKKRFDFWIARYPRNDIGEYNPNSKLRPTYKEAVAWQYSSKGRVNGITGVVDLDVDFDGQIILDHPRPKTETKPANPYKRTVNLIKKGMKNESVKWLQYALNQYKYGLVVDGDFGQKTYNAVIDFQSKHCYQGKKLIVDGLVGLKTISALENG